MDKTLYDENSISSVDPREHVRLRPGMYCGDTSTPNQLMLELFSNSLDEHNIGHGNKIIVAIGEDGVCSIEDFAQGFVVGKKHKDSDKTILEASFSTMNTSGKYSDDGVYGGSSLGINGIGTKIVTFLSEWVEVTTYRDNKCEYIRFEDGYKVEHKITDENHHSGTYVKYKPDDQFFGTDKTSVTYFKNFFEDITCLCPNLVIELNGNLIKHNGIEDMLDRKRGKDIDIIKNHFTMNENNIKLAMTFTSGSSSTIIPYVNYGYTTIGPHITGIKSSITRIFNNWAKENHILGAKDKNLDGNSIQEGMLLVFNVDALGVGYNAQVKTEIVKIDTSTFVPKFCELLELWLDNNPEDARAILEKAIVARKASEAAKKAREAVKGKASKKDKVFKLPTSLVDCWTKNRSKAELLICEGKSSQSGLVAARNSEFQSVYGVRGKMLSVLKTKKENIMKNQEINNLIVALGLDYDIKTAKCVYDKDKLRYGKIIAAADADFDGFAIENLLFNILWYICPELIINGHVYSSVPPLYRVTTKKNKYIYLRDDSALDEYKKEYSKDIQSIGRMKGLGEQDSDELAYCLLEPETRNLYQLTVSDIKKTNNMFNDLYGKNVEPRVKFLSEHLEEARVD